ncbi:unnamed protein product [Wuchereria bancrofti]|uniref:Uncharacterized protein n=1 Tax=Wuchereria bancrofti TaxID=6293 RepID=A0A3P7DJ91_WUCBA|nr:unnamed protein product [Wuchereria bancrofti]
MTKLNEGVFTFIFVFLNHRRYHDLSNPIALFSSCTVVIIFQYMYRVLNMINFCSCSAVILSGPHPNFSQFFHKCRASQSYHHYLSPLRQWATRSTNAKFLIFNLF